MGARFAGLRIPRFIDALHLAEERGIGLVLDFKDQGMGPAVLEKLRHEGMLDKVRFGGEWQDVKQILSPTNEDPVASVEPPVTKEQVEKLHAQGKVVVANFSANAHEMDLPAMRSAVQAGADWINVDYPRLGADAIGHPVESKIAGLVARADASTGTNKAALILDLAHYDGFPLQSAFERWLLDGDDHVSRAAAVALLMLRPPVPVSSFVAALNAEQAGARKNAAWALGMRSGPVAASLLSLLNDKDPGVLEEALLALSRCPGEVPAGRIEPFLSNATPLVRGAAALALARHQPEAAAGAISKALEAEEASIAKDYASYVQRGKPPLSQPEIDVTVELYRCLMKLIESGVLLHDADALKLFEREAFRSAADFSSTVAPVAGFQLWDRIAADPLPAIQALNSTDPEVANRAEWILVKAGPAVLPPVRSALKSDSNVTRERAIRILAWQGDAEALPLLRAMRDSNGADPALIVWAIGRIQTLAALK